MGGFSGLLTRLRYSSSKDRPDGLCKYCTLLQLQYGSVEVYEVYEVG